MLANAVQYTRKESLVQPGDGTISPLGSESISVTIPTDELPFGISVIDLVIDSNDPVNPSTVIPITLSIDPPVISVDPTDIDYGTISYLDTLSSEVTLVNTGGSPLVWEASLIDNEDRSLASSPTYEDLRTQYEGQMIPRQEKTLEFISQEKKRGIQPILNENSPENRSLESQDEILPPEAYRNLNGGMQITMLMDNTEYSYNVLDALSQHFTDYTLTEAYTNWNNSTLEDVLEGSDLVLVPYGHWVSNYDNSGNSEFENYLSGGGGIIFMEYQ